MPCTPINGSEGKPLSEDGVDSAAISPDENFQNGAGKED
jgi:hypothetical protein